MDIVSSLIYNVPCCNVSSNFGSKNKYCLVWLHYFVFIPKVAKVLSFKQYLILCSLKVSFLTKKLGLQKGAILTHLGKYFTFLIAADSFYQNYQNKKHQVAIAA